MSVHTPGPWEASAGGNVFSTVTGGPVLVVSVPRPKGAGATARRDANARLIAAAPALADALEAMRNAFEYCECCQRRMIQPSHDPEECGSWHQAYLQADAALRAAGRLP